jgi:hypothetical protein
VSEAFFVEKSMGVRDGSGAVVDSHQELDQREAFRLHRIIDVTIVSYEIDPSRVVHIVFRRWFPSSGF